MRHLGLPSIDVQSATHRAVWRTDPHLAGPKRDLKGKEADLDQWNARESESEICLRHNGNSSTTLQSSAHLPLGGSLLIVGLDLPCVSRWEEVRQSLVHTPAGGQRFRRTGRSGDLRHADPCRSSIYVMIGVPRLNARCRRGLSRISDVVHWLTTGIIPISI